MKTQFGKRGLAIPKTNGIGGQDDEKWFVRLGGEVCGPYTIGEIKTLADQSLLEPASSVCSTKSGLWEYAGTNEILRHVFAENRTGAKGSDQAAAEAVAPETAHNFVLIVTLQTGSLTDFEFVLVELGQWSVITPGCWALKSALTLAYIRNALTPLLGPRDSLVITDTHSGQISTFNIGIEREVKLKQLWNRTD